MRAHRPNLLLAVIAALAGPLALACAPRSPRDVDNGNPRSVFVDGPGSTVPRERSATVADRPVASPRPTGTRAEIVRTVAARALAVDSERIYLGIADEDALVAIARKSPQSEPIRLARRAPMAGALSIDPRTGSLAWIANPGDAVMRLPSGATTPTTIRDRGIFTHVVASDGDVLFTEVQGDGGLLTRVTGTTSARLATFEGTPRGLTADDAVAFIATSTRLVAAPRARGEAVELARGVGFSSPQVDDSFVYATAADGAGRERVVVRTKKTGGDLETVASGVRDAPLALDRGTLYWFDARRPALVAMTAAKGGTPRVVSEDPVFEHVDAMAIEGDDAYVAAGSGETARLVRVRLR